MLETFDRVEKKYLLNPSQYEGILEAITSKMEKDRYFHTHVMSIYYDTPTYQMIRRSIEKPEYKEKIRIRSYGQVKDNEEVFVEMKKKLDGVVYKRRTKSKYEELLKDINNSSFEDKQVGKEIKYALNFYKNISPKIFIGVDRDSYISKMDDNLRITFDMNMKYRMNDLSLNDSKDDKQISENIVMEVKAHGAIPLWFSKILDDNKAYPRGFSKVGEAFLKEVKGGNQNVIIH